MHDFLATFFSNLFENIRRGPNLWTFFGFAANLVFASRFVLQWYVSERLKRSVIPIQFWYLSIVGSIMMFIYSLHVGKAPFIIGTAFPVVIYVRNLMLIYQVKESTEVKRE